MIFYIVFVKYYLGKDIELLTKIRICGILISIIIFILVNIRIIKINPRGIYCLTNSIFFCLKMSYFSIKIEINML